MRKRVETIPKGSTLLIGTVVEAEGVDDIVHTVRMINSRSNSN